MNDKYPLKLGGISVSTIWGGNRLYDALPNSKTTSIGETWKLSIRDDKTCYILNGKFAGISLSEYINIVGYNVVSNNYSGEKFPILIKFIDATDKLSIQVHPDDEHAWMFNEKDSGKTEMWYIVDADDDAEIVYGLIPDISISDFARVSKRGDCRFCLNRIKVKTGDVFFIPPGMVHAIGKGILIAEIQQNSDITYRVYDYDRVDAEGNKRELHTEKAFKVMRQYNNNEISSICYQRTHQAADGNSIVSCKHFDVKLYDLKNRIDLSSLENSFHSIICVQGSGTIRFGKKIYKIHCGDCWYIPAGCGEYSLMGNQKALLVTL